MTPSRLRELETNLEAKLTKAEIMLGWHWCPDWDQLLINKFTSPEREGCSCYYGNWID